MKRTLLLFACLLVPASAHAARLFSSTALLVGIPDFSQNVVVADLNRDGLGDLVTELPTEGIGVSLSRGGGSFAPFVVSFTGHGRIHFVDVADFDGDGLLDVGGGISKGSPAVPDSSAAFVLYGDGNGGWQGEAELTIPGLEFFQIAQGDLDGDGRPELVLGRSSDTTRVVVRANLNRTLTLVGSSPSAEFAYQGGAFGDVTGSSAADVVITTLTGVSIYEGNGDGTLGTRTDLNLGSFTTVRLAPIDNVPGLDLVLSGPGVSWASGLGGGAFAPLTALPTTGFSAGWIAVGDFDGNGTADILGTVRNTPRGAFVFPGDGTGGFGAVIRSNLMTFDPWTLAIGDVDGDGRVDFVANGAFTSDVLVALGQPGGRFGQPQSIPTIPGRLAGVVQGDFDEDGHLDVVGGGQIDAKLVFAHGHGDGIFDPLVVSVIPANLSLLVAGRFDGDAHLDLVGTTGNSASVSFLRGHGDGSFDAPVNHALPGQNAGLVSADVDGDGDLDVAVPVPNAISILRQGPGGLSAPASSPTIAGVTAIAYADLNGDGRIDRVVSGTNQWRVELDDGVGGYTALAAHPQAPTPGKLVLADFDDDGRLDLAVAPASPNAALVHTWRGQPGGVFDSESIVNLNWVVAPSPANQEAVGTLFAADFDGDGRVDLLGRSGSTASSFFVARGNGDRTFGAPEAYAAAYGASGLVAGDFDEDGRADLMASGGTGSQTIVGCMTFHRNLSGGVVGVSLPATVQPSVALAITRLAPNPSHGAFALDLAAASAGPARITLVSLAGRVVLDRTVALTAGANRVPLQASGLRPGVYWARVEAFGQAAARKVVVLP